VTPNVDSIKNFGMALSSTILKAFLLFPPQWGGFTSFFTLQLQLQIAILQLLMLVVVFFLA
jgi:hypothetical protein